MSAQIAAGLVPPGLPSNINPEERKQAFCKAITLWIGNTRLDQALERLELGRLEGLQRVLALRNGLIVNCVRHCRQNPRAGASLAILTLITFMADNSDGICRLSMTRMAQIFARSERSIRECINSLEADGLIGVSRNGEGLPNLYWPKVPAGLAEVAASIVWFADALSDKPKARIYPITTPPEIAASKGDWTSTKGGGTVVPGREEQLFRGGRNSCAGPPEQLEHSTSLIGTPSLPGPGGGQRGPHLSGAGFVISRKDDLIIGAATVEDWRLRFSALPDLEAQMQKLASVILKKGPMHAGWGNPEAWMVGCLADDNRKAADAARVTNARVASAQRGQPTKTFRR